MIDTRLSGTKWRLLSGNQSVQMGSSVDRNPGPCSEQGYTVDRQHGISYLVRNYLVRNWLLLSALSTRNEYSRRAEGHVVQGISETCVFDMSLCFCDTPPWAGCKPSSPRRAFECRTKSQGLCVTVTLDMVGRRIPENAVVLSNLTLGQRHGHHKP